MERRNRERAADLRARSEEESLAAREQKADAEAARAEAEKARIEADRIEQEARRRAEEADRAREEAEAHRREAATLDPDGERTDQADHTDRAERDEWSQGSHEGAGRREREAPGQDDSRLDDSLRDQRSVAPGSSTDADERPRT
ncbi:hypothetical protein BJF77_11680 [Kocuria sp. CNJ-770]|uniref:hypothetical protein n=1 Tax=Kocuria sp. CNJ-770 TaxID=1904964 RepID=UPI000966D969|nr:hypothetical protein [Kocuria sp. CNJ-770]OLT08780.1 hypothetical protein BJF77_11680 [Kocuria sp. CNJ-770]